MLTPCVIKQGTKKTLPPSTRVGLSRQAGLLTWLHPLAAAFPEIPVASTLRQASASQRWARSGLSPDSRFSCQRQAPDVAVMHERPHAFKPLMRQGSSAHRRTRFHPATSWANSLCLARQTTRTRSPHDRHPCPSAARGRFGRADDRIPSRRRR